MPLFSFIALSVVLGIPLVFAMIAWRRASRKLRETKQQCEGLQRHLQESLDHFEVLQKRYQPIIDIEKAAADVASEVNAAKTGLAELKVAYADKKATYDRLVRETSLLSDKLDLAELGIYEPTFELGTSAEYAAAITVNSEAQKKMVSDGSAVVCPTQWTVDGSKRDGTTMTNRGIRMTLRAFNNECEVIASKVTWKNYKVAQERIARSRDRIDALNASNKISITEQFYQLKLEELRLTHEERLQKHEEQEKLREDRAASREEEKAQREIEAEIKRHEKDEAQRRDALAKARMELEEKSGAEREKQNRRIAELEDRLEAALEAKQRAMSMAQQTRMGHVYVISNIGSFGEQIVKIGLTRRVDPLERVRELGDASVPFPFDVHALVFSDDAPALERQLQVAFAEHRLNRVNSRKEFFRVDLQKVKSTLAEQFPGVLFSERPDAREYYQSLKPPELATIVMADNKKDSAAFPAEL